MTGMCELRDLLAARCIAEDWAAAHQISQRQIRAPTDITTQPKPPMRGTDSRQPAAPTAPTSKRGRSVPATTYKPARRSVMSNWRCMTRCKQRIMTNAPPLVRRAQAKTAVVAAVNNGSPTEGLKVASVMQLPDGTIYVAATENLPNFGRESVFESMGFVVKKNTAMRYNKGPRTRVMNE